MGKKCIPGVICIENMTLVLLILLIFLVTYIYYVSFLKREKHDTQTIVVTSGGTGSYLSNRILDEGVYTDGQPRLRNDPFRDPYSPPLKNDVPYFRSDSGDIRGQPAVPVNVQTRGCSSVYTQLGILTRSGNTDMILPLMGRRIMNGRDKFQYYTISNTGNLNTKLPIRVKGKSASNEYGCDEIFSNDTVYVEGYNDSFRATIYENGQFTYIPVL
jgi:hypothetical protein